MQDRTIRPTMKFIQIGFALAVLADIAAFAVHYVYLAPKNQLPWLPILSGLLLLMPLSNAMKRQFMRLDIKGDKLYWEVGLISKNTRIIQIPRIQDVRVQQSIGQRMFGVGDLSIETAGETSRLTVPNLDNPKALAEEILEQAGRQHGAAHV